jgi:hypothetical protein
MIGADMMARPLLVHRNKGKLRGMSDADLNLEAFAKQAGHCRALNSPLTADMLEAAARQLDETTQTGRGILGWTGNPIFDALPLRLAGGLHALARSGEVPSLTALYRDGCGNADQSLADALASHDAWLSDWLDSPPQTNEVMRSGALMAGLIEATVRVGLPIELLELGASAGLNNNLDRFAYDLGGRVAGVPDSPVRIVPDWTGAMPPDAKPQIIGRAGVDQRPVDVSDDETAARLIAYVWPDQKERLARIEAAIGVARAHPPAIEEGDAGDWIEARLRTPQADGVHRIVMHSVFWQYLMRETRDRIHDAITKAGKAATDGRPFGWLKFEPVDEKGMMALKLRLWPSGDDLYLADCHPHGMWIKWRE